MAAETSKASGLLAILLVTRTRPGPKLVFCYPPNPKLPQAEGNGNGNGNDSNEDSDSDTGRMSMPTPLRQIVNNNVDFRADKTPNTVQEETSNVEPDGVLGFSEDSIEKLLSPGRWCDREKFEVGLDKMTFVGHPIYAANDGSWRHKHTNEAAPHEKDVLDMTPSKSAPPKLETTEADDNERPGITITEPKTPAHTVQDFTHIPESFETQGLSLGTSINSASTTSAAVPEPLLAFNVVLVMRAGKSGNMNARVSDLHKHVVKKLSKALHYCQKHSSYVGRQSRTVIALKAKSKQDGTSKAALCQQMVDNCELAWALKEVYEKISIGAVADIRLEEKEMSLYIPAKPKADELELGIHTGLLLLEDKDLLLRELAHSDASPLVHFLRGHTPTKSLQKLAGRLGMNVEHVLYLARYLITWQKARAIAPLHPRNIYVMGPGAPLGQFQTHATEFAHIFPVLPSLSQILNMLSGPPIQYGRRILSRDHREPFMAVLAYLVRNRFVQHLKTSGWLRAPADLSQRSVDKSINQNRLPLSVASLLSPQLRAVDDDTASVSSERTAIPLGKTEATKRRPVSTNGTMHPRGGPDSNPDAFSIITCPLNPTSEERKRLQYIKDTVSDTELADRFMSLLRNFDGESVLEEIGAREGLKRSKVDAWLDQLQKDGFLLTFYHL